jgi:uncharacterized membrane protein YqjE
MFGNSITKFLKLDNLIANLTGYVETKVELLKVELKEDLASGIGTAINYLILAFVFALVILFISMGTALMLAENLGNFYGFGIVATFYLIIGLILLGNRKTLTKKFTKQISENFKKKKK